MKRKLHSVCLGFLVNIPFHFSSCLIPICVLLLFDILHASLSFLDSVLIFNFKTLSFTPCILNP
jgi:hypothetical protein